ncbi:hypothetical protein ACFV4N_19040 [Actinosynnema sp. NPDC059797]
MSDLFQGLTGLGAAISQANNAMGHGFTISADAGEPLIAVLARFQQTVERLQHDLDRLATEPPLGTTPAAQVYKPFLASIAGDPVQGSNAVLRNLQKELVHMSKRIHQAMELYATTDRNSANDLSKVE